ncbi:MAG: histidine phosphatase family protein [Alphaproteobacteria bacterium]
MTKLTFIRHGEAASGWDGHADPGLSEKGKAQAEAVAQILNELPQQPIRTSPLARCQQTAIPLAGMWNVAPTITPEVAELPSLGMGLEERTQWLRKLMMGKWADTEQEIQDWKQSVLEYVLALEGQGDQVIFSHFIAINVLAGHAAQSDSVIVFKPDNCSVTTFDVTDGKLTLIEQGNEADTVVR